jgi:tryptophan synthase alpha chain
MTTNIEMNRLATVFAKQKERINIFVTAGYPSLDSLPSLVSNLVSNGIDIIEVGMPYSDPLADGEVIQNTSAQALANGITVDMIFDQLKQIRAKNKSTPILLMGYFNQMLHVGVEAFLKKCQTVGVDGLIIPDLPYKVYLQEYQQLFEHYGIKISFLITRQTSESRIKELDKAGSAFLYIVSDNSITGGKTEGFSNDQLSYFEKLNKLNLSSNTMIGFGISNNQMVKEANKYADGAIIGSAYLEAIRKGKVTEFVEMLTS